MRPPVQIQMRGHQLARLRVKYEETTCPRTRLRVQMVLLSHDGYSVEEIAKITRKSDDTVRYWLHRFQHGGCSGLWKRRIQVGHQRLQRASKASCMNVFRSHHATSRSIVLAEPQGS